jgi:hypothetical protein
LGRRQHRAEGDHAFSVASQFTPGRRARARSVRWRTGRPSGVTLQSASIQAELCILNLNITIGPVIALLAGILILVVPRLLSYIVAAYLIMIGLLELLGANGYHLH